MCRKAPRAVGTGKGRGVFTEEVRRDRNVLCRRRGEEVFTEAGGYALAAFQGRAGLALGPEVGSAWLKHNVGLEGSGRGSWRETWA